MKRLCIFIFFSLSIIGSTGCTAEKMYRGIPEGTWQQLSGEQKQLIIDRSFQDEVN